MKLKRRKNLEEAINVQNTTVIGTAKGYDVFDILTFEAAEHFVIGDSNESAGKFVKNESTFNSNIHDDKHLYFFVRENQNNVDGAVITGHGNGKVHIQTLDESDFVDVDVNFLFETSPDTNGKINKTLPLYLIPGSTFADVDLDKGTLVEVGNLLGVFPQLTQNEDVVINCNDSEISMIDKNAFNYGQHVSSIIITEGVIDLKAGTFNNVDSIKVTLIDKPDSWDENWNEGKEEVTTWAYGLEPEEIEAINAQRREEQEQRRQAEFRNEAERLSRDIMWYEADGDITSERYIKSWWEELNDLCVEFNNSPEEVKNLVTDEAKETLIRIEGAINTFKETKVMNYRQELDLYISQLPEDDIVTLDNYETLETTINNIYSMISEIEGDYYIDDIRDEEFSLQELKDRCNNLQNKLDDLREEKRARDERLKAEREARKLRYKVEGKNITITGTRLGVTDLNIPEEIEGKPVTKIAAYAFYDNKDLVRVKIPKTVKLIEKGAFLDTSLSYSVYVAKDCVIGKYNTDARFYRS